MLKSFYKKNIQKRPGDTSGESWLIYVWEEQAPEIVGVGECLSNDEHPDYLPKLKDVCRNINDYESFLKGGLGEFPSIQIGLEAALKDLTSGGSKTPFPPHFTRETWPISINHVHYEKEQLLALCEQVRENKNSPTWEVQIYKFIAEWLNDKEHIKVITSDSSGKPRTIELEKQRIINSARMTGEYFDLKPNDNALLCLPVKFIGGKMMLLRAMVLGLNLITVSPSANPLIELPDDIPIQFAAMLPLQVHQTLAEPNTYKQLENIAKIIIGGGTIGPSLKQKLNPLKNQLFSTYGMTETIAHIAVKKLNGPEASEYYHTLNGVQVSSDDKSCLTVHAPHLSAETVVTNDLVEMKGSNQFKWLGRYDNVINSGGIKIIPETLEKKIESLQGRNFFFAALEDEQLGEKVTLVIQGEAFDTGTMAILKTYLNITLERFEIPRNIFFIDQFLTTGTGKVKRKETLESCLERH